MNILCVYIYIFLWTICIEEVYILIYTPLLYVNYSTSIRYSWMINDCKLFLGYMWGNPTQMDKWKPTSVKYVTSRTFRSQRTPISVITGGYWRIRKFHNCQCYKHMCRLLRVFCENYRSPSHAYMWTTPKDFILLLHGGLMIIVSYIKWGRSVIGKKQLNFFSQ